MANLHSEEKDCPSILEITKGDLQDLVEPGGQVQKWQSLHLRLSSGSRQVSTLENEECLLCRHPSDEVHAFVDNLKKLLEGKVEEASFEPSEPSFELNFGRSRRSGFKVEAWLDAGNGTSGIYTWDAAGIRFCTTEAELKRFIDELLNEFPPL